jgi:cytochrome P450
MASELPSSSEWTETTIHDKLLRIVAKSTGRIFIGPECCRDETYIEGSTNFIADMAKAAAEINKIPWLLRPFKAPRLPMTKLVRGRMQKFADILEPVIRKRKQDAAEQGDDYQKPDDMTQWMIESVDKIGDKEVMDIALEQAGISFSAVNSTTQHTSLAFFTLAANPELGPMFLEEINECLAESGGEWTNHALQNMKKLDSFLKEVGRFEPFTAYSFARKFMKPVTLSNGMHLPKNTVIEIDWYGISRDEEIYPDADKFDALRHYNLRKDAGKQADLMHQFVNISPTHLTWNYGRRACPGRFFAANIMKLMFANLLLRYEVRNAEGVEGRVDNIKALGMVGLPLRVERCITDCGLASNKPCEQDPDSPEVDRFLMNENGWNECM